MIDNSRADEDEGAISVCRMVLILDFTRAGRRPRLPARQYNLAASRPAPGEEVACPVNREMPLQV